MPQAVRPDSGISWAYRYTTLRGEEQHPVVRGRREHVLDDVLFLQVLPARPCRPPLLLERVDGKPLHVAGSAHRDDHVLLGDQVLDVELPVVGLDLRAPAVRVLHPDLEELDLDHAAQLLQVLQQHVEVRDLLEQLRVLLLELGLAASSTAAAACRGCGSPGSR